MDLDGEMRVLALIADSAIKMYLTAVCVRVCGCICLGVLRVYVCVCVCALASKYLLPLPRLSLRPPKLHPF